MKSNGKLNKIRFAALRRVSTEQQEKTGESLRTQTKDIEEIVRELGGSIVAWYGGQEHATPGHEKKEVTRLLSDAEKQPGRFDAVIVAHPDRWSRDNTASRAGLETFRENGIRFFAGGTEYDLFNPDHELFLGISAVIGQFQARNQMRKSLINRINRAKRGVPTSGKLPFGRTYVRSDDGQSGHWEIDPAKKEMIQDCAKRYLAGESLSALADEYNVNMTNLHKVLTKVSGTKWEMNFSSKVLNIHEVVSFEIPRLLPDDVIRAVRAKFDSNRTFTRGHIKYQYLFSRAIFCAHCGYAMFGQTNHSTKRYYRHAHAHRTRECSGPGVKAWIPAEQVEEVVMRHLFETFGNPLAVAQAIADATPNTEKIKDAISKRERTQSELSKAKQGLERILDLVLRGTITDKDADSKLTKQKDKIQNLENELDRLEDQLSNIPAEETIRSVSQKIAGKFRMFADSRKMLKIERANRAYEKMTFAEKRMLCQMVFNGRTAEGFKMGIKIVWNSSKKWRYRIEGHFIDFEGSPVTAKEMEGMFAFGGPTLQKQLVTKNANHCKDKAPHSRRCEAPTLPPSL